jgi:hypothetical protein
VLNDYYPAEMPGAANIAFEFALLASKESSAEFWCGSTATDTFEQIENLTIRKFLVNRKRELKRKESLPLRIVNELFPNRGFLWVLKNLIFHRPGILWINQIGLRFPRSIILASNLLKIRTIVTVHDFTYIIPRKLYPHDLSLNDSQVDYFVKEVSSGNVKNLRLTQQRFHQVFKIRLFIMRQILKTATCLVFISDLQKSIYEGFFFRSGIVIPNGVSECRCLTKSSKREPDTVLFAGRSAGKGLENLISQINASNFILHLAGGPELEIIAATHLDSSKFIYHGLLNQGQLFELMHTVAFVSVISECFDVFPSVSLEAMRHGALVLCNRTIGSANLVEQFSSFTVLKYNTAPDLNRLSALSKIMPVPRLKILRTPQEVLDHYIITIKSIETC